MDGPSERGLPPRRVRELTAWVALGCLALGGFLATGMPWLLSIAVSAVSLGYLRAFGVRT
jgi:hypothetical protein